MSAGSGCPGLLAPVCDVAGDAASGIANDILSAVVNWFVQGASWLLQQVGGVITSTTTIHLGASWFGAHYTVMAALAGVVALPMLLLAAIQAVYHQSPGVLARAAFVHLPLAGLLTAVAVQLVQLSLTVVNALSSTIAAGAGAQIKTMLSNIASWDLSQFSGPTPTFVIALGALLTAAGALALWLELIVRAAAVYVAVLFLPLALASLVWPAVSHWCRRLVETLAAIVLSKFVVVAVLSLAVGALAAAPGFGTVLAGGAMLLLAAFTPFTLLRLVPMVEVGAAMQLEAARHRIGHVVTSAPKSAASFALRQGAGVGVGAAGITPGLPGTGTTLDPGVPGADDAAEWGGGAGGGGDGGGTGSGGDGGGTGGGGDGGGTGSAGGAGSGLGAGGGGTDSRGSTGSGRGASGGDDATSGLLPLGPMPAEWFPTRKMPPGPIPVVQGDPEATLELMERMKNQTVVPTGAGGIIPGVQRPIWGGTEPRNRFVPGPKDNWTVEDYNREREDGPGAEDGPHGGSDGGGSSASPSIFWWPDEEDGPAGGNGAS